MLLLIPLGGSGQRFKNNGYKLPKALINVYSKPILYWLLDNLNLKNITTVIIPYNKEYVQYRLEDKLKNDYSHINFMFLYLENDTRGAAETAYIALSKLIENNIIDQPILSLDSDNFYTSDIVTDWNGKNKIFAFTDTSDEPIYSYVKTNNNDEIIDIVEKCKISHNACTGAYGFNSFIQFHHYCKHVIDNNIMQKNEFYISTVVKCMLNSNTFNMGTISKSHYVCLGTPLQLRIFTSNYPKINAITGENMIQNKRYCFDLDNTLVTYPKVKGDYTTVEPIEQNIKFLQYLKKFGNYIIISTARRMKTHNGNVGKVVGDIGLITLETLKKFNIPYDEIYFGKPYADYYIDDNAVSAYDDLEKHIGYYDNNIDTRDFNRLNSHTIELYRKESNDLSGQIHYYNHIPLEIKDMFPIMFDYDKNNKWYVMDKIYGIPISKLYLSQTLTVDMLHNVMNSLNRIHKTKINILSNNATLSNDIDIYQNYSLKLKKRYDDYDYSIYNNSKEIYCQLLNELTEYEKQKKGICTVIHGDPVLTNIMLNDYGKIKFIDMRGKIGDTLTIYGDALYDWSKLYQSFIGYDEILSSVNIDNTYKSKMIQTYIDYVKNNLGDEVLNHIKLITKSLLFTLIPLHHNDKCVGYYNLIFSKYLNE